MKIARRLKILSFKTISKNAFAGCDHLSEAIFEDPYGWETFATGSPVKVEELTGLDKGYAANNLKFKYADFIWEKQQ